MSLAKSADNQLERALVRRTPAERRLSLLHALWRGSFARRRLGPRRETDRPSVMTDWFQPHLLAAAIIILILSTMDALLTLALVSRGAVEINPLMEPLVRGSGSWARSPWNETFIWSYAAIWRLLVMRSRCYAALPSSSQSRTVRRFRASRCRPRAPQISPVASNELGRS